MAEDEGRIRELLAGLIPQDKPSLLNTLLSAIPQAIAVGFSQNPAEMLQLQLNQRQDRIEKERERVNRVKQLGVQLEIEDILARRKEARDEKRQIAGEQRQSERDIAKFNRESGFQEKMANLSFDQNRKLVDLKQFYDSENLKVQNSNARDLENLRSSNNRLEQKIGQELAFIQPLVYSKYFTGKSASELYEKISRGEKPTAEEDKLIGKAYDGMRNEKFRQELSLVNARNRGVSGSESPITKAVEWAQNKATTTVLGMDAQGQVHELQKDMMGQFTPVDPNVKVTKYLNQGESFRYFFEFYSKIHPEAQGLSNLFGTGVDIPDEKAISLKIDDIIKSSREKDRLSDAEIVKKLNDPLFMQAARANPQMILDAIQRNKLNPNSQESPLPPALGERGTPEATAVSDIKPSSDVKEATAEEIREKVKRDLARVGAANIVNGLVNRIQKKNEALGGVRNSKSRKMLQEDIEDLKERLKYAISQHPELKTASMSKWLE